MSAAAGWSVAPVVRSATGASFWAIAPGPEGVGVVVGEGSGVPGPALIRVRDDRRVVDVLRVLAERVADARFLPDGRLVYLACACDPTQLAPPFEVRCLDLATGADTLLAALPEQSYRMSLSASADGAAVLCFNQRAVFVLATRGGVAPRRIEGESQARNRVAALSPDATLIAHGGVGLPAIQLLDAQTGTLARVLDEALEGADALCFDPTGRFLAANVHGARATVVYRVGDGARVLELPAGAQRAVPALAFSPDGALFATGEHPYRLAVYSTHDWSRVWTHADKHRRYALRVAFSGAGTLYHSHGATLYEAAPARRSPGRAPRAGGRSIRATPAPGVASVTHRGWTAVHADKGSSYLYGGTSAPDGSVYIAGMSNTLLRSTDGGQTFSALALKGRGSARGITASPDGALYHFGDRGLAVSRDRGATWAPDGPRRLGECNAFAWHPGFQLALGYTALHRRIPGQDWEAPSPLPRAEVWHQSLLIDDAGRALLVGGGGAYPGYLLRSTDRGGSWQDVPLGPDVPRICAVAAGEHSVYLAGERGVVWVSADGGQSFSRQVLSPRATLQALCVAGEIVYAADSLGAIHCSRDAGAHWDIVYEAGFHLSGIFATSGGDLFALGSGPILRSRLARSAP